MHQTFRADRSERIVAIEEQHFWFVGRRRLVVDLASSVGPLNGGVVIDVGCGTGRTLRDVVEQLGARGIGLDLRPEGLRAGRHSNEVALGTGSALTLAVADVLQTPVATAAVDLALALDVIEHVDDAGALGELNRVLRPGGTLVVTVPAFGWLWSHRDEDAGHLRRYTSKSLRRALESAGFNISRVTYYQCLLFPLVVIARFLGRRRAAIRDAEETPHRMVNAVFRAVTLTEVAWLRRGFPLPWGSSLVAVATASAGT